MAYEDVFRSIKVKDKITLGASAANPSLISAAGNFFPIYGKSTATSGDSRNIYSRLYLAGVGGAGESVRSFTTVSDVAAAGAHGAHISLSFGTSGSVTGLGVAERATLQVPNSAMTAGTYAAIQAEIYCDGSSSDPSGVTELSAIRVALTGDGTGLAKADTKAALIALSGNAINTGKIIAAKSSAAVTHVARILVNGTPYYIMLSNQV